MLFNRNYDWYIQGANVSLLFATNPYLHCFNIFKDGFILYARGYHTKLLFARDITIPMAKRILNKQMKDGRFIDRFFRKWNSLHKEKMKIIKENENIEHSNASYQSIIFTLKRFSRIDYKLWKYSLYPEIFDTCDAELIREILKKEKVSMSDDEINTLSKPLSEPIIVKINNEANKLLKKKSDVKKILAKKYHYIHNDWAHVTKIKPSDIRISKPIDYKKKRIEENKKIVAKYKLSGKLKNLFHFFQILSYMREKRKEDIQISNAFMCSIISALSKSLKYSIDDLKFLTLYEFINILEKKEDMPDIKKRKKEYLFSEKKVYTNKKREIKEIEKLFESNHNIIKGKTAFRGIVKGRAKIIIKRSDFSKFKKGDILIAPMTRPHHVPLMKKASAIITDEGGITSHAAIISREFRIPCIIGTQIATEVLKDGDIIKVDADNGIIERVK